MSRTPGDTRPFKPIRTAASTAQLWHRKTSILSVHSPAGFCMPRPPELARQWFARASSTAQALCLLLQQVRTVTRTQRQQWRIHQWDELVVVRLPRLPAALYNRYYVPFVLHLTSVQRSSFSRDPVQPRACALPLAPALARYPCPLAGRGMDGATINRPEYHGTYKDSNSRQILPLLCRQEYKRTPGTMQGLVHALSPQACLLSAAGSRLRAGKQGRVST